MSLSGLLHSLRVVTLGSPMLLQMALLPNWRLSGSSGKVEAFYFLRIKSGSSVRRGNVVFLVNSLYCLHPTFTPSPPAVRETGRQRGFRDSPEEQSQVRVQDSYPSVSACTAPVTLVSFCPSLWKRRGRVQQEFGSI